jgi:hypothetical protein
MERRLLLAMALLCVAPLWAGEDPLRADVPPDTTASAGCLAAPAGSDATLPDATDLADGVVHYGFLRDCIDGRPPLLTLDLVQYFQGAEAVRAAAADGVDLEADVDPVVHVRNRNPRLRQLGVKLDAQVLAFDCAAPGCPPGPVHLDALPWGALYRFALQDGLISYIELPYTP